jgi:hypothetical protein
MSHACGADPCNATDFLLVVVEDGASSKLRGQTFAGERDLKMRSRRMNASTQSQSRECGE